MYVFALINFHAPIGYIEVSCDPATAIALCSPEGQEPPRHIDVLNTSGEPTSDKFKRISHIPNLKLATLNSEHGLPIHSI